MKLFSQESTSRSHRAEPDTSNLKLEFEPEQYKDVGKSSLRAMEKAKDQFGRNLVEHAETKPTMVVFLRHIGCTFCREAVADISEQRYQIEAQGLGIVMVTLSPEREALPFFADYGLQDLPRICDPGQLLYNAFSLKSGSVRQLFGPKVWFRGLIAGLKDGHGLGKPHGDVSQMPGVFVLYQNKIIGSYIHKSAADRPDYSDIAGSCAICG